MTESINDWVRKCFVLSREAGWWEKPDKVFLSADNWLALYTPTKIALIHSEVSEAMEGFRKGLADDHLPRRDMFEVELADAVIRIFDLAGAHGMDLEGAMAEKLEYNAQRVDHTLEHRATAGGKKF